MEREQNNNAGRRSENSPDTFELAKLHEVLRQALPETVTDQLPEIIVHEDNVLVILSIDAAIPQEISKEIQEQIERQLIQRNRDETRRARVLVGQTLEHETGLPVSWGMRIGKTRILFTNNTKPVMTRLSLEERQVLDTLVDIGVARTRSAALSYIVRLFAQDYQDWVKEAREALTQIDSTRNHLSSHRRQGAPPANQDVHSFNGNE